MNSAANEGAEKMDRKNQIVTCPKCNGKGRIEAFSHYGNGVCFGCSGSGVVEIKPSGKVTGTGRYILCAIDKKELSDDLAYLADRCEALRAECTEYHPGLIKITEQGTGRTITRGEVAAARAAAAR